MSSQDNKDKNQADTQNTMAEKFAQAVEFCKEKCALHCSGRSVYRISDRTCQMFR